MNKKSPKSSSFLFGLIGLALILVGGGLWYGFANQASQQDIATVQASHGNSDEIATVNGQGVVHLNRWGYDVDAAFVQAKKSGKPVIMMVTADWCGPCQILKKNVLAKPEMDKTIQERFTPVVRDLTDPSDSDIQKSEKWKLGSAIPVVLIFDKNGDMPVKEIVGVVPQDKFTKWLDAKS